MRPNLLSTLATTMTYGQGSQDFLEYLNKNQRAVKKNWPTNVIVKKQYASFLEQSVFQYKRDNLENENQEFAHIINEYREGLLLFELIKIKIVLLVENLKIKHVVVGKC